MAIPASVFDANYGRTLYPLFGCTPFRDRKYCPVWFKVNQAGIHEQSSSQHFHKMFGRNRSERYQGWEWSQLLF